MNFRKIIGLTSLLALLMAGVWLVSSSSELGLETSTRREAVRQLAGSVDAIAGSEEAAAFFAQPDEMVDPTSVVMSEIPTGEFGSDSMYERWLAGEIDLESEGRLSDGEMAALRRLAMELPADSDIQILNEAIEGGTNLTPGISFASLDFQTSGATSTPPDPELAVGENYVISVVNTSFAIYNKSNGSIAQGATSFSSFFNSVACPGVFDPNVIFDEEHDRYVLAIDGDGSNYCIGVSATENALGTWHLYKFTVGNGSTVFMDYPHLGAGQSALFMGGNIFNLNTLAFVESRVWAFDKSAMYAGSAVPTPKTHSLGAVEGTPQPLHFHGFDQGTWPSFSEHYFVSDPYDGTTLTVHRWPNALASGTPTIVAQLDLNTATGVTGGLPVDTPQQSGSNFQANDYRMRDFEYRNGSGWVTDSISCNPGGGTVNCVRWAEVNLVPATPTIVQAGVQASSGQYRIFPNLAVDRCDNMAVGYSKSSTSMFPGVFVAGRESTDPAGSLQDELQLKAGEVAYTGFDPVPRRFGDYSGMAIDPNGFTFWYLGEYSKN
ncbi:MAG: hypothetical protein KDE28_25395, partial [Anaerolineales bacterium]|nr:hypothetical protein [Anaerolineales bacterium]